MLVNLFCLKTVKMSSQNGINMSVKKKRISKCLYFLMLIPQLIQLSLNTHHCNLNYMSIYLYGGKSVFGLMRTGVLLFIGVAHIKINNGPY